MSIISSQFNECCGNPQSCTPGPYPCELKKKHLQELAERQDVLPIGAYQSSFDLNPADANRSDQTVFSTETLRSDPVPASELSPVEKMRAQFRADALAAKEAAAQSFEAMKARAREQFVKAEERVNSPEARAERQALQRSRGRDFGMDM